MLRVKQYVLAVTLAVTLIGTAHADTSAKVKVALQGLYDKENAAADAKNAEGCVAYVSPNFKGVDENGKTVTYGDVLDGVKQVFTLAKSVTAETSLGACKASGTQATIAVSDTMTVIVSAGGSQDMTLINKSTSQDTWTKTSSGWRLTYSRVLSHKATINGQPAPEMPG